MAYSLAFITPPSVPAWQRWLIFSPPARIVLFAAMLFGIGYATRATAIGLHWADKNASPLQHALAMFSLQWIPTIISYLILVRLIERRRVSELSPRDIPTFGLAGLVGGMILFSTIVGVLWLVGSYHVTGTHTHFDWLPEVLVAGAGAGLGEEIVFRGGLFRIVEEGMGTWCALIISALFFGGIHIFNPGATLWSALAIAVEAGVLLALVYHVTRSLWACVGLHAAWNLMQGTIYGIPVSGIEANGWLISHRTGPDWLSGGVFGAEASVVSMLIALIVSAGLLTIALRRHSIVPFLPHRRSA